ncbi:hypothetical protein ACN2XU_15255 [Primorskyibacter sp. 2E107]
MSRFKDRIAVIAGADHPLGASLVRRLAGFGATVVALGSDEEAMLELAREFPGAVEPLVLRRGWREVVRRLQQAWEDEPVHLYIDLFPLGEAQSLSATRDLMQKSAALAAAFATGLRSGEARAVLGFAQGQSGAPNRGTRAAGYAGLVRHLDKACRPGRFLGLSLDDRTCSWTPDQCLSAGDTLLMLCHPVSRGVMPGTVVAWRA